jgi:hypothetical protein
LTPRREQTTAAKPKPDIATMTAALRLQTCELLKLDPAKLLPADEILVARCGALRLLVSDCEAAQLRGEQIHVASYVEASRELETLFRNAHHIEVTEGGDPRALIAAREKLGFLLGVIQSENDDAGYGHAQYVESLEAENGALKAQLAERSQETLRSPAQETLSREPLPQPALPPSNNVVPIVRSEPAYSPLVISDVGSVFDSLNRRAW